MSTGKGVVKTVLSGDTLVIYGKATSGPPPEREITLSHVIAPRISRLSDRKDEPYAWESREFLRKLVIGKVITFKIDYSNAQIKREFGTVMLGDVNVNERMLAEGWVKLRPLQSKDGPTEEYERLMDVEADAKAAGKGVWRTPVPETAVRSVLWNGQFNNAELFAKVKGKPLPGVVEMVRDGSSMRVLLLPSFDSHFYSIMVHLTGIQCPTFKRVAEEAAAAGKDGAATPAAAAAAAAGATPSGAAGGAEKEKEKIEAQPFAAEAKFFTECRLLNRDVTVTLEFLDKYENFFGTVLVPEGNITEELLRNGLARVVDWSVAHTPNAEKLRAAERRAKEQKLRLFKDHKGAAPIVGDKEFVGQVVEVPSGDMLTVHAEGLGDRRVTLSSIRAPRLGRRGEKGEDYSFEAREFLRRRLIGQKVRVLVDFTKPAPELTPPVRTFATVYLDGSNVAELAVKAGWAQVVRHAADDENRSRHYDALVAAEQGAKKESLGMWSKGEAPKHNVNDLSQYGKGLAAKAKTVLPSLQRGGRLQAVVEHVINGARMVLYVPKESALILFGIVGVRCPKPTSKETAGEPYGDDALRYSRRALLHRNVEVEIESADKTGTFIGRLYLGKKEFSLQLVRDGCARVFSAARPQPELQEAETLAKQEKRGLWAFYDETQEQQEASEEEESPAPQREVKKISVSEIVDGAHFYARFVEDEADTLDQEVALAVASIAESPAFKPERGTIVAAKFTADEQWYRAVVEERRDDLCSVFFMDYGNREDLPATRLRPLPAALAAVPPRAHPCVLSYIIVPTLSEDYGTEAASLLRSLAWGKTLMANIDGRRGDLLFVTVFDPEAQSVLNEAILRAGLGRVKPSQDPRHKELLEKLRAHEELGRQKRLCLWRHGDPYDSDDEGPDPQAVFGVSALPVAKPAASSKSRGKAWGTRR